MGREMGEKKKEEVISDAYEKIEGWLETLDVRPYLSTLIGLRLASVARHCGKVSANKLIDDFGLEQKGWKKVYGEVKL